MASTRSHGRAECVLVLCAVAAWAAPITRASAQAPVTGEETPTAREADDVWRAYDHAFELLAAGDTAGATATLEAITRDHAGHPAAERSTALLERIRASQATPPPEIPPPPAPGTTYGYLPARDGEPPPPPPPDELRGPESETSNARAELVFFQTLHGILVGVDVCLIVGCEDTQPWVLSTMLGAGAGFTLSYFLSSDGVTPGLARALTSGVEWGFFHGVMLGIATEAFDEASNTGLAFLLGQLGGLGAGLGLYNTLEPTAGQVSLASSGGIWTAVVVALAAATLQPDIEPTTAAIGLMLAADLGLLGGALLASEEPMSAGRVLLIDGGGLLGGLVGLGLALLVAGDRIEPEPLFGTALFGTVGGLVTAYLLTREWDVPEEAQPTSLSAFVTPIEGGAVAGVGGRL